jgi:dolichol-phosphate mannosyltransferase
VPAPKVSIIIPTLNEAENLPRLVPRIAAALSTATSFEILILDDSSRDQTSQVCATIARRYPLRLITRQPANGLAGAVLDGLHQAGGEYLVVMDADLQHPPESIPDLLAPLENGESDFTLGSRYITGGRTQSGWSFFRKLNSKAATILARPFAGPTRDPMSGFFALKRETFQRARHITPMGYKIGLELICKCGVQRPREIPIHFATRTAGRSKLNLRQQVKYLEHLSRLYDYVFPRFVPAIKFLFATTAAWMVGFAVYLMALAKDASDGLVAPPPAIAVAYAAAIITTAVFHLRYTRTQREFKIQPHAWRNFAVISLCEWISASTAAILCSHRLLQISPLELFLVGFLTATLTRYVLRKHFLHDLRGLRKQIQLDETRPVHPAIATADLPRARDAA